VPSKKPKGKPKGKPRGRPFEKRNSVGVQFKEGNPGGPGRPRRAVEEAYHGALVEGVPLDDWKAIVARAVKDAKAGDARAREWLGKHLIGDEPLRLLELAEEVELLKEELSKRKGDRR
jgi:hypothetical protein